MGRKHQLRIWRKANESKAPASWKRANLGPANVRKEMLPLVEERLKRLERRYLDTPEAAALRAQPCTYCGEPGGTVDHIIPVALGGTDDPENLTSACRSCNSRKGTKLWGSPLSA